MKLKKDIIELLKADRTIRLLLCDALDFKEQWIDKCVEKNKANGPLTTASALKVIRETFVLTDNDILEESEVKEGQS